MRLIVAGCLHFSDIDFIRGMCRSRLMRQATVIMECGGSGVAYEANKWAHDRGLEIETWRPSEEVEDRQVALCERNRLMINAAQGLVIIYDGRSDICKELIYRWNAIHGRKNLEIFWICDDGDVIEQVNGLHL